MNEEFSELLFNLGSADRLDLLRAIGSEKQRLTRLSKVIDASAQECSRHLLRLTDSGLIRKDSDGLYETTPLGRSVLRLFPSLEFLLRYKKYFQSHDMSFLPQAYLQRIGELSRSEQLNHLNLVLEHIKSTISKAKEYAWLLSDQPIVVGTAIGSSFSSRDLPVRLIGEQSIERKIFAEVKSAMPRCELGVLPEVKVALAINESIAGVCFSGLDGKIDFSSGFSGSDDQFREWCSNLFEYYWSKSRKSAII